VRCVLGRRANTRVRAFGGRTLIPQKSLAAHTLTGERAPQPASRERQGTQGCVGVCVAIERALL
jgi:hypothetical protein